MFTAQCKGPKCCVSRTLEGSPCYRSGSCAICTGPSSNYIIGLMDCNLITDDNYFVRSMPRAFCTMEPRLILNLSDQLRSNG